MSSTPTELPSSTFKQLMWDKHGSPRDYKKKKQSMECFKSVLLFDHLDFLWFKCLKTCWISRSHNVIICYCRRQICKHRFPPLKMYWCNLNYHYVTVFLYHSFWIYYTYIYLFCMCMLIYREHNEKNISLSALLFCHFLFHFTIITENAFVIQRKAVIKFEPPQVSNLLVMPLSPERKEERGRGMDYQRIS